MCFSFSAFHAQRALILMSLCSFIQVACKPAGKATSNVKVVNGTIITTQEQAKKNAPGAYGVQIVYKDENGNIKQREASGFFTDPKGTTFITNAHVAQMSPPPGYTEQSRTIVDYQGKVIQTVSPEVETYINPGSANAARDLAMWRFPEGTTNLTHGSAKFAAKGYDLEKQQLSIAGYGTNTNSESQTPQYQKMRYGPIGTLSNPTGNTFGYSGPKLDGDGSKTVSSAPGDSGAPIYTNGGEIVGINRGGSNGESSSYSEAINPYGPGASSFFKEVVNRGGVVQGYSAPSSQKIDGLDANVKSVPNEVVPNQ